MKKGIIVASFLVLVGIGNALGQKIVFDRNHFNIVNENGAVRLGAENTHNSYLNTINSRLDDINLNVGAVVVVQTLIRNSLVQVNQALKSGIAVNQIAHISSEIIQESNAMISIAKADPHLLLFAEDVARQMKNRGINLVSEVSAFVLKEGNNILMDYEKREALLRKIILELKVIRALCYSMAKSMYWAKVNGVLKTVNPFRDFINQDIRISDEIINNIKYLKN
jgi:archaellum component FlaC